MHRGGSDHRDGPRPTDERPWAFRASRWVILVALSAPVGCRLIGPDNRYDLLEAEIRTRDRELSETRSELNRLRQLNQVFGRPPLGYAGDSGVPGCDPNTPDLPARRAAGRPPTLPLKDITIGSGTGGVDDDGRPGDESLQVVIAPRDDDGTVVKVPARALIRAFEVSTGGLKTQIGQWEVTPEQMRRSWKSGLLSSGYFVPLQWDRPPTTSRLRVVARIATADGQEFEADKEVTVRPLPGPTGPTAVPGPSVPAPAPANELPPPTALPPRTVTPPPMLPPKPIDELPPPAVPPRPAARLKLG